MGDKSAVIKGLIGGLLFILLSEITLALTFFAEAYEWIFVCFVILLGVVFSSLKPINVLCSIGTWFSAVVIVYVAYRAALDIFDIDSLSYWLGHDVVLKMGGHHYETYPGWRYGTEVVVSSGLITVIAVAFTAIRKFIKASLEQERKQKAENEWWMK